MQNIWKIVSLAGVVGICFLIALMAQNGLQNGQQVAVSGVPATDTTVDLGDPAPTNVKWPDSDDQWEPDVVQNETIVIDDSIIDPFANDTGQPELVDPFPVAEVEVERSAFPELPELGESNLVASDPFPDDSGKSFAGEEITSFNPVDLGPEPFSAPPVDDGPDPRESALELMRKSYEAIDASELLFARDKAVAAGVFDVAWGPLEETPANLVARIDGMLMAARLQNVAEAAIEPEPFPSGILPVAAEEPFPAEEPAPVLVTEFGPDPFADTLPDTAEPRPTIDLPELDEPATLEPFAEVQPEPELSIELPALEEPLAEPFPAIAEPELVAVPVEPEPALIEEPDPVVVAAEPAVNSAFAANPDVTIRKVAPAEAMIGDPLIYSIEISNNGETNASEVIVEDRIPTGCKLVGTIPQAELIGSKILWRLGRLPAKSAQKFLIKVVPLEEGEIGSVATVNFVAEVSTSTSVKQAAKPEIKLEVKNRETAKVGENVLFQFRVANEGSVDARDVSLQDIVPIGFEHPAGKDVTYEIGDLPAGKAIDIDLELTAVKPGQHVNRAIVKSGKDSKVETAAVVEVVEAKGLTIQSPSSRPQPVAQKTSHEFTVTNESTQPIVGAAVNVILPQELAFFSASDDGSFTKASNSIRWNLPAVQPNETVTLSTTVIPRTYGVHRSRVQLIQPDQPMEQTDSLVEASGIAALRLTLENAPATVLPGEDLVVDFSLVNKGTGPDSNVQFSLVLPTGVDFVSARGPVRNLPPKAAVGGRTVGFATIPEIGEGASVDFQVILRSQNAGQPKIRAEVRSDQLNDAVATEAAIEILDTTP
ncbi:MAG: hypothetical protein P8M20_12855 [Planctomycetaceae bacterium]|nr:hypothetical protein [Planctomycetaceae bacterium]